MREPAKFAPEVVFAYDLLGLYAVRSKKTTYRDLYNLMAPEFDWPAWKPGHSWFKRLPLAEVASLCGENGEPCLSALVRHQDGTIGKGYQTAHFNCHGVELTTHDYACECGNCHYIILNAARDETKAVFRHWSDPGRQEINARTGHKRIHLEAAAWRSVPSQDDGRDIR